MQNKKMDWNASLNGGGGREVKTEVDVLDPEAGWQEEVLEV